MEQRPNIPFNIPAVTGREQVYINEVIQSRGFCGDKTFTRRCEDWLKDFLPAPQVLLTASCTQALEIAALLLDLGPEDEVILPSYTFVSTANAFVLRGAQLRFVDIEPQSMNIDLDCVEAAITSKTKVIVPVHYAGMSCDMTRLMKMAEDRGIFVVEDAAQALSSTWDGQKLGTFGHLACFSFHETKNYHCGEGGALVINDQRFIERAEIIREKGTNRKQFFEGLVDKYTWVDIGTSGLMSELQAAFLLAQLESIEEITCRRLEIWEFYAVSLENKLSTLKPDKSRQIHNGHIFGLLVNNRSEVISKMRLEGILTSFHYLPLHQSAYGSERSQFFGQDNNTSALSRKILRLPIYSSISMLEANLVINSVKNHIKEYED